MDPGALEGSEELVGAPQEEGRQQGCKGSFEQTTKSEHNFHKAIRLPRSAQLILQMVLDPKLLPSKITTLSFRIAIAMVVTEKAFKTKQNVLR